MDKVTVRHEDRIAVLVIDNPPVNALGAAVRAALKSAVERAAADASVLGIVIASKGRTFIAGADISEFGKPQPEPLLPDVIAAVDAAPKPIVAAITGATLGGGLEVALACHARIAVPGAKLGLPEVKLGILPGAGGTQRLPRLIGAAEAIRAIATGEPFDSTWAKELGLVDEIAADPLARAKALCKELAGGAPRRTRDDGQAE